MKIYIDFDDCLCETGRAFTGIVSDMFGISLPYEDMRYFNLQKSFRLTDEQFDRLMIRSHEPDILLSFEETPGASETVREWISRGWEVSVITGRPFSAYEPSRTWLDRHGLREAPLYCLDKYGRENFLRGSVFSLKLENYYKMTFDAAVEDSPEAFRFFAHLPKLQVMVFDRPWNRETELPGENYSRCFSWENIREKISRLAQDP